MPGTAAKVFFTEVQMEMLEEIVASRTASVRLVQRAQIVLLAYQKRNNEQIGEVVDLNPQQVSVWRKRWKAKQDYLIEVECGDTRAALRRAIRASSMNPSSKGWCCFSYWPPCGAIRTCATGRAPWAACFSWAMAPFACSSSCFANPTPISVSSSAARPWASCSPCPWSSSGYGWWRGRLSRHEPACPPFAP